MTTDFRTKAGESAEAGVVAPPRSGALTGYQPALDGLRGVAMAIMLSYHAQLSWARGAFLGLSQFFTLSGFLITAVLLRADAGGGIDLKTFWIRRMRRLVPGALLGIALVVVFGATVATHQQATELPGQLAASATYTANWFFIASGQSYVNLFSAPSPIQHYWSLAVEEQFYLLMPISTLLVLKARRSLPLLGAIFSIGAVLSAVWMAHLYQSGAGLDRIYYGTDTRMAELLAGAVLAVILTHTGTDFTLRTRRLFAAVGLVAYAVSMWLTFTVPLANGPIWRGGMLPFSVLSCLIVLGILSGTGPLVRFLEWEPFAVLGRLTYGIYLYHWPIFLWLTEESTGLGLWPLFTLRVGLTLAMAALSYNLVEMPVRNGALTRFRPAVRFAAAPAIALMLVGVGFVTVNRDAPDPLATLRLEDDSLTPPVVPTDGVLDMVVITDEADDGVIDELMRLDRTDSTIDVTRAPKFHCDRITTVGDDGQTCENWLATWPSLIAENDPDVVLFYVDDWSPEELKRLSQLADAELAKFAGEVLGNGFDLLSAQGAPIVWAASGADFGMNLRRSYQPFHKAMADLEPNRTDLRHVLGGRLPDKATTSHDEFVRGSAAALIADASLYQRADGGDLSKVLIVGDSQARSLGYGLERWGQKHKRALVWNVAVEGCGVLDQGRNPGGSGLYPVSKRCKDAVGSYSEKVESFDPDIVIMLTSIWDLQDRQLDEWESIQTVGDDAFDAYLLQEYTDAVDVLSSTGAKVIWMQPPCSQIWTQPGQADELPDAFETARLDHLNRVLLPELAERNPDQVRLFDLDGVLCPEGEYVEGIDGVSPVRVDGIHFSVEGSLWFADRYGSDLLEMGES